MGSSRRTAAWATAGAFLLALAGLLRRRVARERGRQEGGREGAGGSTRRPAGTRSTRGRRPTGSSSRGAAPSATTPRRASGVTIILHGSGGDHRWGFANHSSETFRPDDLVLLARRDVARERRDVPLPPRGEGREAPARADRGGEEGLQGPRGLPVRPQPGLVLRAPLRGRVPRRRRRRRRARERRVDAVDGRAPTGHQPGDRPDARDAGPRRAVRPERGGRSSAARRGRLPDGAAVPPRGLEPLARGAQRGGTSRTRARSSRGSRA